jgi:predicted tellurium resistance membrane protein TerC
VLDIVFSLDSVITAVGMAKRSDHGGGRDRGRVVMLVFAGAVGAFIERHRRSRCWRCRSC